MKAVTKWYDRKKGFGIVKTKDNREFFVHYASILMDGYRYLESNDLVEFEVGIGHKGCERAVNVRPILTRQMIREILQKEKLQFKTIRGADRITKYVVVNENNVVQSDENGMSFLELAAYAGINTDKLSK